MDRPVSNVQNIDCKTGMSQFPDKFFDLAVCDIEYGIGASKPSKKPDSVRQKNGTSLKIKSSIYVPKDWDFKRSDDEYFEQLFRVSKNQIIFGANYYQQLTGGMIVWDKLNGETDQYGCEIAYQSFNNRTDIVYYLWSGMIQGKTCSKNVREALIQEGNKKLNEERIHPTQKPVKLYSWLLENYAKSGDKIIDTHLGSQSSRIASYKKGFDFWGFELDKDYFKEGNERFEKAISMPLFDLPKITNNIQLSI